MCIYISRERCIFLHGAVGQLDLDRLPRLALQKLLVLGVELVPDLVCKYVCIYLSLSLYIYIYI